MPQTLYMRIELDYENPSEALSEGIKLGRVMESWLKRRCMPVTKVHMDGFGNSVKEGTDDTQATEQDEDGPPRNV